MASKQGSTCQRQNENMCEPDAQSWRRKCGCIRTSDKLKKMLNCFPSPPPPTPLPTCIVSDDRAVIRKFSDTKCTTDSCMTGYCYYSSTTPVTFCEDKKSCNQPWLVVSEVVQLVQLSVTATALAIYYIIYCYMQLIYYTLRSAIYFHNADGPMKITIGVVTLTSLVVGFNILVRMERVIGILF